MGELTQLRGVDVVEGAGAHAIKISPEAGTIKTGKARTVPLHDHLIEQGFVAFVKANGDRPLFYNEEAKQPSGPVDPTNPRKPRYVKAREEVATWVRILGVNDPELSPNHAWRHTFKGIGFRSGMSEKVLDSIVGHAPASVGRSYGEPTLADKTKEKRCPRSSGSTVRLQMECLSAITGIRRRAPKATIQGQELRQNPRPVNLEFRLPRFTIDNFGAYSWRGASANLSHY